MNPQHPGGRRVLCVIGYPIGHSVSPAMQNAAIRALGLSLTYLAFQVHPRRLGDAIRGAAALGIAGMNVTIPHKSAVLRYLDSVSPRARALCSVNTICFGDGGAHGDSTDGPGFLASLRDEGVDPAGGRAVLIGAGGSARAVAHALLEAGSSAVTVAARDAGRRADALAALAPTDRGGRLRGCSTEPGDLRPHVAEADMVVNCTPLGMSPRADAMPPIQVEWLRPEAVVCDLIYNPPTTLLLERARARGCRTIDGRGMLVHQGALSLAMWTGFAAPVDTMREALDQQLGV